MKALLMSIIILASVYTFACPEKETQIIEVNVTENGFEPSVINVNPDHAVKLKVTRKTDSTCATSIQIPDKKVKKDLPLNKTVVIELGHLKKGDIRFGCSMNMMVDGNITVK